MDGTVAPFSHRLVKLKPLLPAAVQLACSLSRVAAFAWAVLQIGRWPDGATLLYFVGFLPFSALFDILCQSWARSAQISRARWISDIGAWRIQLTCLALGLLAVGAFLASYLSTIPAAIIAISLCCLFGSLSFIFERWLAETGRAMSLAAIEIVLLASAVTSYSTGIAGRGVLMLCFVSYLLARMIALLLPGKSADLDALPVKSMSSGKYLAFALGQQIFGATAASIPAIYAAISGSTAGLALALAQFRLMHSFAAMASFAINAVGSRLFFGEASHEMRIFEQAVNILSKWKLTVDSICLVIIAISTYVFGPIPLLIFPLFVAMLAIINVRSSLAINMGFPQESFYLQGTVLLLSIVAIAYIFRQLEIMALFSVIYGFVSLVIGRHIDHSTNKTTTVSDWQSVPSNTGSQGLHE